MDQHLKLILDWFTILGIEGINEDKLKRQLSIITSWFAKNYIGVLEAVTGFGKTMVAIITIYRLNLKFPDFKIIVVVPSLKLKSDWEEHVDTFGLKNVEIYVVNSYVQTYIDKASRPMQYRTAKWKCDLLVLDEIHNYLSDEAMIFNQTINCTDYKMLMGLSATLNDKEKTVLDRNGISIIDQVTLSEARRDNYVSDYIVYNYGVKLSAEEQERYSKLNDIHNSNYGKFFHFKDTELNWQLANACRAGYNTQAKVGDVWRTGSEWREWYSNVMEYDGTEDHLYSPRNISKYANQWNWAMIERKNFLYKHPVKVEVTIDIIKFLNVSTITFAETTEFADELASRLGDSALAYHTNLKAGYITEDEIAYRKQLTGAKNFALKVNGKIGSRDSEKGYPIAYKKETKISAVKLRKIAINKFETGEIKYLCTAKALDEGFNVEGIECAVICSGSSKKRQYVQRIGRSLRFKPGKVAKIINVYIKDTQDETWLKSRQKGDNNIRWITDINEINTLQ